MSEPTVPPTPLPAPPPPAPFQVRVPGGAGPATWTTPVQGTPPTATGAAPPLGGLPAAAVPPSAQPQGAVARSLTNAAPPRPAPRRRRRHAAQRSRTAAVVMSSVAFVALVGCTALGSTDKSASTPASPGQASTAAQLPQRSGDDRPTFDDGGFAGDAGSGRSTPADSYGSSSTQGSYQNGQSNWGGSSGGAVAGTGSSYSAPVTRSQGS